MTMPEIFNDISLFHYLSVGSMLFVIAILGLLASRKSIITILMSIELMLLSVNVNFVAFSGYLQDITGQIFSIFIIAVAAAETAIGLAILITFFRNKGDVNIESLNQMRG